jgi:hypothetical protein
LLELSCECNNLHVLVVAIHPGSVGNHVLVHLFKAGEDSCLVGQLLHDPAFLQSVNKGDELFGRGGEARTEDFFNETTLHVRDDAGLGMDFLEDLVHLGAKVADIVLHVRPEFNGVKLSLKMTDFNNGLRLGNQRRIILLRMIDTYFLSRKAMLCLWARKVLKES